jgi:hypothetical protein
LSVFNFDFIIINYNQINIISYIYILLQYLITIIGKIYYLTDQAFVINGDQALHEMQSSKDLVKAGPVVEDLSGPNSA